MRISEIDYLDQNRQQYTDKLNLRLVDSGPMGRMFKDLVADGKINPSVARSADNYLGLMSKCGTRGNCAMTRFRSQHMLAIQLDKRTGKKKASANRQGITPEEYEQYGIHIEHSVPVNLKIRIITDKYAAGQITDYKTFTDMYQTLSVGVGMTRREENANLLPGMGSKHPDITGDLAAIDIGSIRPFARYSDDTVIYDMTTGKPVDLNITLKQI